MNVYIVSFYDYIQNDQEVLDIFAKEASALQYAKDEAAEFLEQSGHRIEDRSNEAAAIFCVVDEDGDDIVSYEVVRHPLNED